MLGIVYQGVAFTLLFTMLPKRGHSNCKERIESLVADREFVGEHWLGFLNQNSIRYYIRIRNNSRVFIPHKNKDIKVSHLFNWFKPNEFKYHPKIVYVNGQLCYPSG